MILSCFRPPRGAVVLFVSSLFLSACSGRYQIADYPADDARDAFRAAQAAALVLYDAMAPSFGEEEQVAAYAQSLGTIRSEDIECGARYTAEALVARCALLEAAISEPESVRKADTNLASVVKVLRKDAPTLFALGRAAEVRGLQKIDFEWLTKMDAIFDGVKDRASPQSVSTTRQFRDLVQRVEHMLARPEPAFGATSLYDVMRDDGRALTAADLVGLGQTIAEAEALLLHFDKTAARWRGIAATLSEYDAMLAVTQERLESGPPNQNVIAPVRRYAASLIDRLSLIGGLK